MACAVGEAINTPRGISVGSIRDACLGVERGGDRRWGVPLVNGVYCSWSDWGGAIRWVDPELEAKCGQMGSVWEGGGGQGGEVDLWACPPLPP